MNKLGKSRTPGVWKTIDVNGVVPDIYNLVLEADKKIYSPHPVTGKVKRVEIGYGLLDTRDQSYLVIEIARIARQEEVTGPVELVIVSGKQLGIETYPVSWAQVLRFGKKIGLMPVPYATVLALRTNYLEQKEGESVYVSMSPISVREEFIRRPWRSHDIAHDVGIQKSDRLATVVLSHTVSTNGMRSCLRFSVASHPKHKWCTAKMLYIFAVKKRL